MTETWGLSYLENLVGKTVTVFKGGPDSRTGVLSAIKDDYLVLTTDGNQAVYYPFSQLKSVIDNTKNSTFSLSNLYSSTEEVVYPETFLDTLRSLQLSHVLVNGGGPASSTGYIIDVKEEFITIATGANGLVFYPLDEIKSLLVTNEKSKEELPTIDFGGSHSFTELLRALY